MDEKITNLTKEVIEEKNYSWEKNPVVFTGDIYLKVFGERLRIGYISTNLYKSHNTMPELKNAIKERLLSRLENFRIDDIR